MNNHYDEQENIRTNLTQALFAALVHLPDGLNEIRATLSEVASTVATADEDHPGMDLLQ